MKKRFKFHTAHQLRELHFFFGFIELVRCKRWGTKCDCNDCEEAGLTEDASCRQSHQLQQWHEGAPHFCLASCGAAMLRGRQQQNAQHAKTPRNTRVAQHDNLHQRLALCPDRSVSSLPQLNHLLSWKLVIKPKLQFSNCYQWSEETKIQHNNKLPSLEIVTGLGGGDIIEKLANLASSKMDKHRIKQ